MARYIDAELLKKYGFVLAKVKTDKDGEVTEFMTLQVDDAPTADVVPKSEVEEWKAEAIHYQTLWCQTEIELDQAKQEVAREIFEEIERSIFGIVTPYQTLYCIHGGRTQWKTLILKSEDVRCLKC